MRKPALPVFRLITDHGFASDPYTLDPSAPAAPGGAVSSTGFNSSDREAIWEVRSTSNGREATVTERAARFNPDPFSNGKGDRRPPKGLIHPLVDRI